MVLRAPISATFKDIPGGQMLGATYDYTHRLFTLNGRMRTPANCTACFSTSWKNRYRQRQKISPCFRYAACRGLDGHLSGGQHTAV
ncbi:MAG: carbon-phosphorus lyase complex subunit PhnI [Ruminococcus sp.]